MELSVSVELVALAILVTIVLTIRPKIRVQIEYTTIEQMNEIPNALKVSELKKVEVVSTTMMNR
jgi:hypothetical protein